MDITKIDKEKKQIRSAGTSVVVVGWFTIIINIVFYLFGMFAKDSSINNLPNPDLSGTFIMIVISSLLIILGNRIRKSINKSTKRYLMTILFFLILILIFLLLVGGRVGGVVFVLVFYIVYSLVVLGKLMKDSEFVSSLQESNYLISGKGWIIFVLVAVLGLVGAFYVDYNFYYPEYSQVEDSQWQVLSVNNDFKILFPGESGYTNDSVPLEDYDLVINYDSYDLEMADGTYYILNVATYPPEVEISDPKVSLENALAGGLEQVDGGEVKFSEYIDFNGNVAMNYVIFSGKYGVYMKGRNIMVGNTLYSLIFGCLENFCNDYNYNKYINSFELLD